MEAASHLNQGRDENEDLTKGVGYAIVQRLVNESPEPLTVILACRNKHRAQEALTNLQNYFEKLNQRQRKHHGDNQQDHDKNSSEAVKELSSSPSPSPKKKDQKRTPSFYHHPPDLKIELVDIGSVASVLAFNQRIRDQYRKIDYLFCNAGILPSAGLMWRKVVTDCFRAPMDLVVRADVLIQPKQHLTEDGIGNVLACNVFGHYVMIKGLEDQLNKTEDDPGRVIWTSSLTAEKAMFKDDDWQGLEAKQPYESSKWVADLLSIRLNEIWAAQQPTGSLIIAAAEMISTTAAGAGNLQSGVSSGTESNNGGRATTPIRRNTRSALEKDGSHSVTVVIPSKKNIVSFTTQPGIVASGIGGLAGWVVTLRIALHYILRICGERHQTITGYHGAQANVYAALKSPIGEVDYRLKYGSCIGRTGKELLKKEEIVEYEESQGQMVVEELEKLRLSFVSS
ncbi:hypothetical protein BGZ65_003971 [Modicella reniformis]|uniref:3-keto-steroid reductase n=1 Tax=Modicella reniformis TaxID=1440133 RepID=A0A9P6INP3_9FUNG|nr:hypothetical protein BGZ65_003971 [Modicella reniformis]